MPSTLLNDWRLLSRELAQGSVLQRILTEGLVEYERLVDDNTSLRQQVEQLTTRLTIAGQ